MQKSELLNQILSDYLVHNTIPDDSAAAISAFCAYVDQWFSETRPVGLGHGTTNLSIRLSDGRELSLFDTAEQIVISNSPAFNITGTASAGVRVNNTPVVDASQSITGRVL